MHSIAPLTDSTRFTGKIETGDFLTRTSSGTFTIVRESQSSALWITIHDFLWSSMINSSFKKSVIYRRVSPLPRASEDISIDMIGNEGGYLGIKQRRREILHSHCFSRESESELGNDSRMTTTFSVLDFRHSEFYFSFFGRILITAQV
jgi:hypothetical protein